MLFRPRQVAYYEPLAMKPIVLVLMHFADIAQAFRHYAAGGGRDVGPDPTGGVNAPRQPDSAPASKRTLAGAPGFATVAPDGRAG